MLTVNGEAHDPATVNLPDGGDRIVFGPTRTFDGSVVNVADALNAIKLRGTGWELGQQLIFTSDGTPPAGLTSGMVYYAVPFGREIIRLAETRVKALAASPSNENDPNIIPLTNGGQGEHQLTLAVNGRPQWETIVGSLTGDNANPLLSYAQPGSEVKITAADAATSRITTETNHGFANGQRVAVFRRERADFGVPDNNNAVRSEELFRQERECQLLSVGDRTQRAGHRGCGC